MSRSFTNAEGWVFDVRPRDMDLFSIPNETIYRSKNWWVYLCHIANSQGLTRRVYFVDFLDHNAWVTMAQCRTEHEANDALRSLKQGKTYTYK